MNKMASAILFIFAGIACGQKERKTWFFLTGEYNSGLFPASGIAGEEAQTVR
jgi:hypothetical protein